MGSLHRLGFAVYVAHWTVTVIGDMICACPDGGDVADCREVVVDGLGTFLANAGDPAIGWGQLSDDSEVLYVYDRAEGGFCYAWNLTAPELSEWGYSGLADAA